MRDPAATEEQRLHIESHVSGLSACLGNHLEQRGVAELRGIQLMAGDKPAVLVVEDEVLVRLAAVDLVESAGFEALEAGDSDEAISILEARSDIRLVFTDVDMPGSMDGLKLSHFIRHRSPPIRIIVPSGKAIFEEAQLPAGTRFFPKPYSEQTIVSALTEMLR